MDPARVPVIVGVGQVNDRPADPAQGLWLGVVPQISFPALDTLAGVPAGLGIVPRHAEQAAMASGDTPVRYLNDAANAIGEGRASVALIVGGEALRTAAQRPPDGGAGGIGKLTMRTASDL